MSVGACFCAAKNGVCAAKNGVCAVWNKKLYLWHAKQLNGVKNSAVWTECFSI